MPTTNNITYSTKLPYWFHFLQYIVIIITIINHENTFICWDKTNLKLCYEGKFYLLKEVCFSTIPMAHRFQPFVLLSSLLAARPPLPACWEESKSYNFNYTFNLHDHEISKYRANNKKIFYLLYNTAYRKIRSNSNLANYKYDITIVHVHFSGWS